MNGEKDRTLALGKEEPESASDTGVPATIGRLRIERLLGQGGMAQVFRAFDPLLGRPVAVKLMYGESPDQNLRLIREARLLAKVDHPHICKIYETGLEGSRPYIVMQLVDGRVLDVAAADLSLTEKLHLFITIAEAVHAAHRIGLIHRDLKPANILVETRPGDPPHPYVLDFGLARELEGIDATATGMITGSPAFMSPEQARGDRALMDTRTDVYGLGATFYSVLSGRLPFDAPTPFETLLKVVSEEPAPLRRAAPRIPADLETIVMKCLEKSPDRRYDSAQALADDIRRFLAGRPVEARPATLGYRASRFLSRHRVPVAAGFLLLAVSASFGIAYLRTQRAADERARNARLLAQSVQEIEWRMRVALMQPLRSTLPERERAVARIDAILESSQRENDAEDWSLRLAAAGRGQLLLGNLNPARQHLEEAWALGDRSPDLAVSLGVALAQAYESELDALVLVRNPDVRRARRAQLDATLKRNALERLRAAESATTVPPEFLRALISFLEGNHDKAIALCRQAREKLPWFQEALLLEGRIHAARAGDALESGDAGAFRSHQDAALAAFTSASEIARSDDRAYVGLAKVWFKREASIYLTTDGKGLEEAARHLIAEAERALEANPRSVEALVLAANGHRYVADFKYSRGIDPSTELRLGLAAIDAALAIGRGFVKAHVLRALLLWIQGKRASESAIPQAERDMTSALESIDRALHLSPRDPDALHIGGLLYLDLAIVYGALEKDPEPLLRKAISNFVDITPLEGYRTVGLVNRSFCSILLGRLLFDRGADALPHLEAAVGLAKESLAVTPPLLFSYIAALEAEAELALVLAEMAVDPAKVVAEGERLYAEAVKVRPEEPRLHIAVTGLRVATALFEVEKNGGGKAFEDAVNRAQEACTEAERIHSNISSTARYRALLLALKARSEPSAARTESARRALRLVIEKGDDDMGRLRRFLSALDRPSR